MALSVRAASGFQSGAATTSPIAITLPAGTTTNDLVYIIVSLNGVLATLTQTAGTGTYANLVANATPANGDRNATGGHTSWLFARTIQVGDTAPSFTIGGTAGKYSWVAVTLQPAAGGPVAAHSQRVGPTIETAAGTSHTPPTLTTAATGLSLLANAWRGSANAATAVTTAQPTNWVEPAATGGAGGTADFSTAVGTTAALRQVAAEVSARAGQTGTITPGAQVTTSVSAFGNEYHLLAIEQTALTATVTDSIGILDTEIQAAAYSQTELDPVGLLDTEIQSAAHSQTATDLVGLLDAEIQAATSSRTQSDPIGILDAASARYDGVILRDAPVAYWPLNDSGSTVVDLAGSLDGTYTATPGTTTMPNGDTTRVFDGATQYAQIPDSDLLTVTTTGCLTLEAWIRPDTLQFTNSEVSGYVHWAGKGVASQYEYVLRMYSLANAESRPNRISGYAFPLTGGSGIGSYFEEPVSVGQWIHVALVINKASSAVFSGGHVRIYKNGVLKDTDDLSAQVLANGTAPLRIGTRDFASFFQGAIGKFAAYDYEPTAAQLLEHYNTMVGPASLSATITDGIGLLDSTTQTAVAAQTLADLVGLLDSTNRTSVATQTLTDPIGLLDAQTSSQTAARSQTDLVGLLDTTAQTSVTAQALTDAVGLLDVQTATQTATRGQTDSVGLLDSPATAQAWAAGVTDTVGLLDTPAQASTTAQTVIDAVGLLDSAQASSAGALTATLTDSIGLTDPGTAAQDWVVVVTDAVGLLDGSTRASTSSQTVLEPIGLTDGIQQASTVALSATVTDGIGLTDVPAPTSTTSRTLADVVGLTDSVQVSAAGVITATITDGIGLLDSGTTASAWSRAVSDGIGLTDSAAATRGTDVVLTDGIGLTDSATRVSVLSRVLAELLGLGDVVETAGTAVVPIVLPLRQGAPVDLIARGSAAVPEDLMTRSGLGAPTNRVTRATTERATH